MSRKKIEGKCALWWCRSDVYADGLCINHYRNKQRHGEVQLRGDALALYGYAAKSHVVFANIVNRCWQDQGGVRVCRYCGELEQHSPNCIVVSVSGLMEGVPVGGRMAKTSPPQGG